VLFSRQDPDLTKRFFYQLASGLKSPLETGGLDEKDPVYWLREKLSDDTLRVHHRLGLVIKAWIAVRDGKIIGDRQLQKPSDKEKFPQIGF
jgi:type IV secretory pathway VirD2 relaxase